MKIEINALEEGMNEVHFKTSMTELGYDEDEEKMALFPHAIFVDTEIYKISEHFDVKSHVKTKARYVCDRCLEKFDQILESSFRFYVVRKLQESATEENDEYRVLDAHENTIDITEDVIENLLLEVPMKHVCKESCRGLCPTCGANLNLGQCSCESKIIDPRWEKLRQLFVSDK
ncbi:MAG: DUF177 domain-containing protein [Calditrichaeota bacterium]|nr:DUF177 domain-containing protein [Calditrichota bacterium]